MNQGGYVTLVGFVAQDPKQRLIKDGTRVTDLRVGAIQGDPKRKIIEVIQRLAAVDVLVLRDVDGLDDAGDVGRHADLVRFDIGVVT